MSQNDPSKPTNLPSRQSLDFGQAISYLFNSPNWLVNLLLPALLLLPAACFSCFPLIGGIVAILLASVSVGYGWEASASLLATNGTYYPDFDFNRIGTYTSRALGWIIFNVIVMLIGFALTIVLVGYVIAAGNKARAEDHQALQLTSNLIQIVFQWVLPFFMHPMMFRVGLTGNAADTFDVNWGWDYFRRMWLEMIICGLVMALVAIFASIVGLLLLIVGVFLVAPFLSLVRGHLDYQMYELYLSRGGIPVTGLTPTSLAGYVPDASNPYAAPAGGGYTASPMYNPPPTPPSGSSSPPSWTPPPPPKPNP